MPDIIAEGVEINIENEHWRLFNQSGAGAMTPFFVAARGEGLIRYSPAFGAAANLPGTILSVEYLRAVVVGFDERRGWWVLGLHVAMTEEAQPRFVPIVHWASGANPQYAIDCHTAGRVLAEYLQCPLKLFGVKKPIPPQGTYNPRATVTGPLVPHERDDLTQHEVIKLAALVVLPLSLDSIWLGMAGNNLTLRLPREAASKGGETPAYSQVVFDKSDESVKLVPQTGLLGAFFGPSGRNIKYRDIRNIELRHTITHESSIKQGSDNLAIDVTLTTHSFEIYLTLRDESLLLTKAEHTTSSELQRRRLKTTGPLRNTSAMPQERQHLEAHGRDQQQFDRVKNFVEAASIGIANFMGRGMVKTKVGML
jgi:hypothetical protein